jgi:hypothetical protein
VAADNKYISSGIREAGKGGGYGAGERINDSDGGELPVLFDFCEENHAVLPGEIKAVAVLTEGLEARRLRPRCPQWLMAPSMTDGRRRCRQGSVLEPGRTMQALGTNGNVFGRYGDEGGLDGQGDQQQRHLVLERHSMAFLLLAKDSLQVVSEYPLVDDGFRLSVADDDEQENNVAVVSRPRV